MFVRNGFTFKFIFSQAEIQVILDWLLFGIDLTMIGMFVYA